MKRQVAVIYVGEAKEAHLRLQKIAEEEKSKGISNSDNQRILNSLKQKEEILKSDPQYGDHTPRKYLNKKIIEKYGTDSIWCLEITGFWRALYTLTGDVVEIQALILDIMNHDDYSKLFGYRKR